MSANTATTHPDPGSPQGDARSFSREHVSFLSSGERCDAWLYRPATSGPHPCVAMAHGIGGIRSAVLPEIAERFAKAGIAALVFDDRHLGTSAGKPRGLIDIAKQREDYRAAAAYARSLDGLDPERIALWGTSFSGGHVLGLAARDTGIAAAVIQNPFVDGRQETLSTLRSAGMAVTARLVWKGVRDELSRLLGREPHRVPLVGDLGWVALLTTPDALPGYASILPADATGLGAGRAGSHSAADRVLSTGTPGACGPLPARGGVPGRPLEGRYPYLFLDAKVEKVRDGGRVVAKALVVAHGVHETGCREILSIDVGEAETEAFWTNFLRGLVARGLVVAPKEVVSSGPPWRLRVSSHSVPRRAPDEVAR
jgi:acetyl esterase/lipase